MMVISLHKYLYFSTEIHPRLLLVAIFKYPDNTQERGLKPKKVTLSLKNVFFNLVCSDDLDSLYFSRAYFVLFSLVTSLPRSHGMPGSFATNFGRTRWQAMNILVNIRN